MSIQEELVLTQAKHSARDQGARPTCVAFALSEVNLQHAAKIDALSPEYVYQAAASMTSGWVSGSGVGLTVALRAASRGQPAEDDFPYQAAEPAAPVLAPPVGRFSLYGARVALLPHDPTSIARAVREHRPVGLGLKLTQSFYQPTAGVIAFEHAVVPDALHAVAVVGLGRDQNQPYLLIRNSWGDAWGINGNAWIPANYVREHALCAFGG